MQPTGTYIVVSLTIHSSIRHCIVHRHPLIMLFYILTSTNDHHLSVQQMQHNQYSLSSSAKLLLLIILLWFHFIHCLTVIAVVGWCVFVIFLVAAVAGTVLGSWT